MLLKSGSARLFVATLIINAFKSSKVSEATSE